MLVRELLTKFDRVIVETTGLADPMPVMHTLATDPDTASSYRLAGVATVAVSRALLRAFP